MLGIAMAQNDIGRPPGEDLGEPRGDCRPSQIGLASLFQFCGKPVRTLDSGVTPVVEPGPQHPIIARLGAAPQSEAHNAMNKTS